MDSLITNELANAHAARAAGNEGKARVCARRAAGWAIRLWYQRQFGPGWGGDAYKQLRKLQADANAPTPIRDAAQRLTTQVNHEHQMPFDNDPLVDAASIITFTNTLVETQR